MRQPTPRQQAASRANGAKSRGPKTAAGKRRSSRNGCKHNLYSRVAPMPPADDPDFLGEPRRLSRRLPAPHPRSRKRRSLARRQHVAENAFVARPGTRCGCGDPPPGRPPSGRGAPVSRRRRLDYPAPAASSNALDSRYGRRIFRALRTLEREEKLALRAGRRRRRAPQNGENTSTKPRHNPSPRPKTTKMKHRTCQPLPALRSAPYSVAKTTKMKHRT